MKIVKKGQAGTMQSSDLMVTVEPADAPSIAHFFARDDTP